MRRTTPLLTLLFGLALPACTGGELPPETRILGEGNYQLVLSDAPSVALFRNEDRLLHFDAAAFQLGLLPSVSDELVYDPYRAYDPSALYTPGDELRYVAPASARFVAADSGAELELQYRDGQRARVHALVAADGRFLLNFRPLDAEQVAYLRLAPRAHASEGFYGLGEYFDDVNHRGHVRAMQIEVPGSNTPNLESGYNEAHVPVPFIIGTRGWGLFVQSPYPGAFAVAAKKAGDPVAAAAEADPELVEATFGTGLASAQGLQFFLYAAEHPLDVTKHYFATTGSPRLPAPWALGPWVWRDENKDQAQIEQDLETIRDLDLPTTGYWIDRPYATAVNTFDYSAAMFTNPKAMMAKMKALGFRTALWHTPYLDENSEATTELRAEANAAGYYPSEVGPSLNNWGRPLDLTNPKAVSWWQSKLDYYRQLGVEGYKLDYMEDILAGVTTKRFQWLFADGSDERTQHSRYQELYHRTYAEMLPKDGGFLLCRGGTYGDQANGVIVWPGDLDANMLKHGETGTDANGDNYVAVGGLPASLVAALSLGPSGFLFYGSDTGGYRHCPPDNETFSRWFEQTALSTVMQIGTSCNDVAWESSAENGFDAQLLERYRDYTGLHLRLFPYLFSHALDAKTTGRPIMRALGLAHPELGVHPNDTYLLGGALLVAPVVERGARAREVTFPSGRWVHWFTGQEFIAPAEGLSQEVDAPIGRLPLFLRENELVPMLRPSIETLSPTTEPNRVDSYATDSGILYVRAVAASEGSFDLYDGSRITMKRLGSMSFNAGNTFTQGAIFRLVAATRPTGVQTPTKQVDEKSDPSQLADDKAGWYFDKAKQELWVFVGSAEPVTID